MTSGPEAEVDQLLQLLQSTSNAGRSQAEAQLEAWCQNPSFLRVLMTRCHHAPTIGSRQLAATILSWRRGSVALYRFVLLSADATSLDPPRDLGVKIGLYFCFMFVLTRNLLFYLRDERPCGPGDVEEEIALLSGYALALVLFLGTACLAQDAWVSAVRAGGFSSPLTGPAAGCLHSGVARSAAGTDVLVREEETSFERREVQAPASTTLGFHDEGQKDEFKWNLLVFALFLAYALCDLDKVNLSVAILPIQDRFGLSEADVGTASSSFFWGYMLTQLPGAMLIQQLPGGAATVLGLGVFIQSVGTTCTAALEYVTDSQVALAVLCASRALVGLGEGLGVPAIGASLGQLPNDRRSSGTSVVYSGSTTGVGLGLLACPFLIQHFGWPFVFWAFASAGLVWTGWWAFICADQQESEDKTTEGAVPWKEILRNKGVWSVVACHAMSNVAFYSLLTWMPTFFSKGAGLSIEAAGFCAFLPYLFGALASPLVGQLADKLLKDGWEVSFLRRVFQGVAFFGGAICMLLNAFLGPSLGTVGQVALLVAATTLKSADRAGLFCTHADLSPRYAGALLALSTTAGAIAPIPDMVNALSRAMKLGCAEVIEFIGKLIDETGSFGLGLFAPLIDGFSDCQVSGTSSFTARCQSPLRRFSGV
ncbi:ANTR1 [Symbiodinium natans]|uniref:ANTR1 protein n=1 Tax=Symbiodinium natans TaxID=878477 RepID=A0A812ICE1_9DINO|nr:ANTR1 [Symbiodinium natans]